MPKTELLRQSIKHLTTSSNNHITLTHSANSNCDIAKKPLHNKPESLPVSLPKSRARQNSSRNVEHEPMALFLQECIQIRLKVENVKIHYDYGYKGKKRPEMF